MSNQEWLKEPTGDQCEKREVLWESENQIAWATFSYPQMGGYCAKSVVVASKGGGNNECFDVYIWHDGEFPFDEGADGRTRRELHHCDPEQFIGFGNEVLKMSQAKEKQG